MTNTVSTETEVAAGTLRVLVVEDVPADAELCLRELKKAGFEVIADVVQTSEEFTDRLGSNSYDIILADYNLPTWTGLDALVTLHEEGKDIPFILVTGSLGEETAVECIKKGATDYVLKGNLIRLAPAVRRALDEASLRRERREAEAERIRLMTAIEQAGEAIVITDLEGRIQYVNPAFTWMTGYSREEAVGQNFRFLKSGQHDELFYQMLWETILAGQVWHGEIVNRRKDGSLFTEEMTITPVRSTGGTISHFIAVKQDVTERRRAEQERIRMLELKTANEALRRADQMKSEFLADMSHELRSPLNSIMGFSELLLESVDSLAPEQREDLAIIHRKAQHLLALVNDLLDLARIEAGQATLERSLLPVREYLLGTLDVFGVRLREKNLQSTVEVEPPGLQVYAEPRRLEQILTNLIANAVRFTAQGGLTLQGHASDDYVQFCVEDTGIGISPEDQPRIFDKFYQARQQAEGAGSGGTGLGLAITKQLVELQGGRIWLESTPGQGSRFFFTLPRFGESPSGAQPR